MTHMKHVTSVFTAELKNRGLTSSRSRCAQLLIFTYYYNNGGYKCIKTLKCINLFCFAESLDIMSKFAQNLEGNFDWFD